jgi:hypothetical protein
VKETSIWIVGRSLGETIEDGAEIQGVFDSEDLAVKACRDENYYVIGGMKLNEQLPHETIPWPEAWYPHLESKEVGTARCREALEIAS